MKLRLTYKTGDHLTRENSGGDEMRVIVPSGLSVLSGHPDFITTAFLEFAMNFQGN
jgi:hypothetical protein